MATNFSKIENCPANQDVLIRKQTILFTQKTSKARNTEENSESKNF